MKDFTDIVAMGALAKLEELLLDHNQIGDAGLTALAGAIAGGAMGQLTRLELWDNGIGDAGMIAFAEALKPTPSMPMGSLANLQTLLFGDVYGGNNIGDKGMEAFSTAIASGSLPLLKDLNLCSNRIGDEGMIAFAESIKLNCNSTIGKLASLQELGLSDNKIGDAGMKAFAKALMPIDACSVGALAKLTCLNLANNRICNAGMLSLSEPIGKGMLANLEVLELDDNPGFYEQGIHAVDLALMHRGNESIFAESEVDY
eukprot:6190382-Prymnesium_polylepis.1